jgi:hypothetical protein
VVGWRGRGGSKFSKRSAVAPHRERGCGGRWSVVCRYIVDAL